MRFLTIFILLISLLNAKDRDFYYSFIDSNGKQIPTKTKETIINTLNQLDEVKAIALDGKLHEAFEKLKIIKDNNKVSLLNADILILYSELVIKTNSKQHINSTSNELEVAINSSLIDQEDLLKAYLILIDLKLNINKVEDARYYAQTVVDIFDDEEAKAKGKISLAKIFKYQKDYKKASKVIFEVLSDTKDKNIASIAANELFDIYLLEGRKEEASELMRQLLATNPSFYSSDYIVANQRVDLLLKLDMTNFAIDILKNLIITSKKDDILEQTKYKLANLYMKLYDKTDTYLKLAKILYKDIIDNYPKSVNFDNSSMFYDEIKMRQKAILPNEVADKYPDNEAMQNKALLQELINNNFNKKYEDVIKMKKIYQDIPKDVLKRFGYENVDELLDISHLGLIKEYLKEEDCIKLSYILKDLKTDIFKDIVNDDSLKDEFINCIREVPSIENYKQFKNIFKDTKDLDVYLILEAMALDVEEIDDALFYSSKIEKSKDKEMLKEEFLYKYQILKIDNNSGNLDRFFKNSLENSYLIEANLEKPIIIDFYYDLYLYLIKEGKEEEAFKILNALNNKQNEFKAFVYSPFVESELSRLLKKQNNFQDAVNYLIQALQHAKNIKPDVEVKLYYDILTLYDNLGQKEQKEIYLQKCKNVKIEENFYKNMCNGINP
ncbi:tetratricopeptide repeat protein [Aliarcobacter cryaerophilus]|uniref:tetratricopeptide repeat protein n=1 Tax=Aliarcobacter cryaerophilus TaxID=28198 RepID=UPI003DA35A92